MFYNQSFSSLRTQVKMYFHLTKPRIVILLSITGLVAFLLPSIGSVGAGELLTFLVAGYFVAGGAMAINNAIDRDMDSKMERTSTRPSIEQMSPQEVTLFGGSLMVLGSIIAYFTFGLFTTLHLAWGGVFYLLGYTLVLKRNTWLNTIVGGLASPAPVWAAYAARAELAGYSYPDGFLGVSYQGWLLGVLVFIWTPSHTWAMAVKNYDDYVNADVPMLPVILGINRTAWLNLIASTFVVGYSLWLLQEVMSVTRLWIGFWISIPFLLSGLYFVRNPDTSGGKQNFYAHNIWLALIFVLFI
ncbi:MAG: UbiA family prenyltransferase [Candidatus Kariarchaeaceae archaeon]|jgi:protoheme IX farnesyltransferase